MTKRITITLDPEIEAWLGPNAISTGKSMSELVRVCLREFHHQYPNRFSMSDKAKGRSEDAWLKSEITAS